MKRISVIVPVLNSGKIIEDCILSLLNQDFPESSYEIIAVDNGSTDKSFEILQKFGKKIRVLREFRRGPSYARNLGIRNAKGQILLFIDSDCVANKDWIREMISPFKSKKVKMVGGSIKASEEKSNLQKYCGIFCHTQQDYFNSTTPFFATANAAARKNDIKRSGYFNPRLLTCDDLELCTRLIKNKSQLLYQRNAVVYHYYPTSVIYFLGKSYSKGKFIGLLTKKMKRKLFVKRLSYIQIFRKFGIYFLYFKLLQDIFFRHGFLVGYCLKKL